MAEIGIDISEWQSVRAVDWYKQWKFVIIRAHSGFREDHNFQEHWRRCGEAGVPRGAYGYLVPNVNAAVQARRMLDIVPNSPELGYWTDAEARGLTLGAVLEHLRSLPAGRTGLYTYVPFLANQLGNDHRLRDFPLWIAGYGRNDGKRHPLNPSPAWPAVIHQFTSYPNLDRNFVLDNLWYTNYVGGTSAVTNEGAELNQEEKDLLGRWMQEQAFNIVHVLTGISKKQYADYLLKSGWTNSGVLGQWMQDTRSVILKDSEKNHD